MKQLQQNQINKWNDMQVSCSPGMLSTDNDVL